jgi:hypothetical protein
MFLVPNIDQMYKEMKKIVEVGNGDEFPDFANLFFFVKFDFLGVLWCLMPLSFFGDEFKL